MLRSIATVSLGGTLMEKLNAIAAAGFDGVEIFENDLLYFDGSPREVKRDRGRSRLAHPAVPAVPRFRGGAARAHGEEPRSRRAQVRRDGAARRRPDAGVQQHRARRDRRRHASRPKTCARSASARRGAASASATRRSPGAGTSTRSAAPGRSCRRPTIRPSGWWSTASIPSRSRTTMRRSRKIPGDRIFFAQLADAPMMRLDPLSWSRHFRCFPGQGAFPVTRFTRNVLASGYNGPISLEIFNDEFRAAPPRPTAIDAHALAAAAGGRACRRRTPRPPRARCASPPPPVCHGFEFIEFAVDAETRPRLTDMFDAMGFAHVGHAPLQGRDPAPAGRRQLHPQCREGRLRAFVLPAARAFGVRARVSRRRCARRDRARAALQGADFPRQASGRTNW